MATVKKKSSNRRKYILLSAVIVVAALLVGGVAAWHIHQSNRKKAEAKAANSHTANTINYGPSTPSDNQANNTRKSSSNPANTLDNGPTTSNTTNPLGVIIVNARRSGTDVRVGNLVNGTTSGTCTLSATQAGQSSPAPVTAQVQPDVNNYDCGVMHISLPDTGTWQVKLTVTNGSNNASATTTVGAS